MQIPDERLTLHRGIAVPAADADAVIRAISAQGLTTEAPGRWRFDAVDLRPRLASLRAKVDLSTTDTRPRVRVPQDRGFRFELEGGFRVVCAADLAGATYYATSHNQNGECDTALVVTFSAALADVFVDGRDFLYTAFQHWDRQGTDNFGAQLQIVESLFGEAAATYFRMAATQQHDARVAIADLATQDPAVVMASARNAHLIRGRYGTHFRAAFLVRLPVSPEAIIGVKRVEAVPLAPRIDLEGFRAGRWALGED